MADCGVPAIGLISRLGPEVKWRRVVKEQMVQRVHIRSMGNEIKCFLDLITTGTAQRTCDSATSREVIFLQKVVSVAAKTR